MPSSPEISVLLAVRNGVPTLRHALRSILNQTFERFELLLIDDASSDQSVEVARSLNDPRIRIIANSSNLGLAASLNRGIDLASGRYIARMDADDVSYPERLALQFNYLESHHEVDLLGAQALIFRGDGANLGVTRAVVDNAEIQAAFVRGNFPLIHPTWMGRTDWFRKHRYDAAFRKAQDYELLLRAAPASVFANLPQILLGYRREPGNLRKRLVTRRFVLQAQTKNLLSSGRWLAFVIGASVTCAKGLADIAWMTVTQRTPTEMLRVAPLPNHETARWADIWRRVAL